MLILNRRVRANNADEDAIDIIVGEQTITIRILEIDRNQVHVGIDCPREFPVWRREINPNRKERTQ